MTSRYQYTKQRVTSTGKRVLATTVYPTLEERADDLYVVVGPSDRLDILADQYYKDFSLWWIIVKANNLAGDSYFIETGRTIRIPTNINDIISDLNNLNYDR